MFADSLNNISGQPYEQNAIAIINHAFYYFRNECQNVANSGKRCIETYLLGESTYYRLGDDEPFDFNKLNEYVPTYNVPAELSDTICSRVKDLFQQKLESEGFKNISITIEQTGPFYNNKFIFGRKSVFKDRANPQYIKRIKISASW